ncbi:MAG: hypothetical protein SPL61_11620 [Saccharofermentans sp.]|nr:hypothetical protein [Saccharofermentans sp.]
MDESTRRMELRDKIEFRLYDIKDWCDDAQREDWEKKSGNKGFFYQASYVPTYTKILDSFEEYFHKATIDQVAFYIIAFLGKDWEAEKALIAKDDPGRDMKLGTMDAYKDFFGEFADIFADRLFIGRV